MPDNSQKNRPIRSFVLRQGRQTPGQKRAFDTHWQQFGVEPERTLDFKHIFNNSNPTTLEIGFGNGDSLAAMAEATPQQNFLGIEVHAPGVGRLLNSIGSKELTNVRVMQADAVEVLINQISDNSLERVQLFFADPWHKKKHHKRRIVQQEFLTILTHKLKSGGVFHMATDWENYAEHMVEQLDLCPEFENCATNGPFSDKPDYRPTTKFETRGINKGHGVWDLIYRLK